MPSSRLRRWIPLAVLALTLTVYLSSPMRVQTDSIWSIPTAASIWLRGDVNLDEYGETIAQRRHGVHEHGGHFYGDFPLGVSLVALPFVAAFDLGLRTFTSLVSADGRASSGAREWRAKLQSMGRFDFDYFRTTERLIASVLTSLAAVVILLTAVRLGSLSSALLVAFVFAFGTSAYSTASRVLWQHAPSMLAIAGVVHLLTHAKRTAGWAALLGFIVACSYVFRPTNGVTVLLVTGFVVLKHRAQLLPYLAGAAVVAIPFCALNASIYGFPLPPYYLPQRLEPGQSHFWEALPGNLISPARGLFVFSPILLVAAFAIGRKALQRKLTGYEVVFVLVLVFHWVAISSFPHWWAGHSIGPRLFSDVIPYFAYFLIAPFERLLQSGPSKMRPALIAVGALILISVFVHARGAISPAVHGWNDGPPNVDDAPERLWDWRDPQFLRTASERR